LLKQIEVDLQNNNNKAKTLSCDEGALYKAAYKNLASASILGGYHESVLETFAKSNLALSPNLYCVPLKDSVYKDFAGWKAPAFLFSSIALGCMMKVGNFIIGTDKLGHFMTTGYSYYVRAILNSDLAGALAYGDYSEKTYFGTLGSGVYSYGDLNANFQGMIFWSRLAPKYAGTNQAYFQCENNQWVLNKAYAFDWQDYVSDAWDEAINVNYFKNEEMLNKVLTQIVAHTEVKSFPAEAEKCIGIVKQYRHNRAALKALVAPLCAISAQEGEAGLLDQELYDYFIETHKNLMDENKNKYTLSNIFGSIYYAIKNEILFIP
jgi:hypothetical protein